jgi:hypothetical protein
MKQLPLALDVYAASHVLASDGVMKGEPLSFADELVMDDVYRIGDHSPLTSLEVTFDADGLHRVDGVAGQIIHLDCCATFMAPQGGTLEALILVEVSGGAVSEVYLLPLGDMRVSTDYRLVGVARHTATKRFAEAANGSFARGTRITMADGAMRKIEDLRAGDIVLTRDAGRQPVKCIMQATLRATGSFAPVVITKGALHNEDDLVVRPDHRLFVYQRHDHLGAGRAEVLIKARHLVDDKTVLRKRGGFIDYFQLIFDEHHIIYAEGIAAESHLVDPRTREALPAGMQSLDHADQRHLAYEVTTNLIPLAQAASLLRKASSS